MVPPQSALNEGVSQPPGISKKKERRFADKLAVPPQSALIYEVSVTSLKIAPQAHICA